MTRYEVALTPDAQEDLQEIYDYVAEHDAQIKADALLDKLQAMVTSLERFPERGTVTKELRDIGITEYREVYFKPYRIIYRTFAKQVIVYLIVDGRRNMQTVLARRLMRV